MRILFHLDRLPALALTPVGYCVILVLLYWFMLAARNFSDGDRGGRR